MLAREVRATQAFFEELLTRREREVAELIASGLSNVEIGEQLFIGKATVKSHINRIFAKFGVADRSQLVIAATGPAWLPREQRRRTSAVLPLRTKETYVVDSITPDGVARRILTILIVWNVADAALHVIADEIEPLRVASNAIIFAVAGAVLIGRVGAHGWAGAHPAHPMLPALLAFIVLNGIVFIDKAKLPIPMTVFVAGTVVGTLAAIARLRPPPEERRIRRVSA